MPIKDAVGWKKYEDNNQDPYGKACIDVAREVMRKMDEDAAPITSAGTHKLICDADKAINAGGITGFMAGCVASMVSQVHSRGEEFRRAWNRDNQIGTEGDKANDSNGVLNPAILNIG